MTGPHGDCFFPRGGNYATVHAGGEASAWTWHSTGGESAHPETRGSDGRARGKSEKSVSSPKCEKPASFHKGTGYGKSHSGDTQGISGKGKSK